MKRLFSNIFLVIMILVFSILSGILYKRILNYQKNEELLQSVSEKVAEIDSEDLDSLYNQTWTELTDLETLEKDTERAKLFLSYQSLKDENEDYVGWIKIPGTKVNYPVVQSETEPGYYLKRNFKKEKSIYGSIFMDSNCKIGSSKNKIIHGHHMRDGSMFATIDNYKDFQYFQNHHAIQFDSLYDIGDYQIVSAFSLGIKEASELEKIISLKTQDDFHQFKRFVQEHSFYDTGTDFNINDTFLTLVTCEYTHKNGKFFIIAKKVN